MSSTGLPKRLKKMLAPALRRGWTARLTKGSHWVVEPPEGWISPEGVEIRRATFAGSPSDHRSDRNSLAELRRMGVPRS